jgi:class 3 adenylate cyclase
MASYLKRVKEILETHYNEVSDGGIVEKSPSKLVRGEGVQKQFYILKIDLVGSTMMLHGRHNQTYLKLIHSFLSTIDKIAQDFGADPQQMEYAGDGLLAYFLESETTASRVLAAACYMMEAVNNLLHLDQTLAGMKPRCRIVLHHASLTVAKIGPRNDSFLTAIGHPLHYVSKLEKDVGAWTIRVTPDFYKLVSRDERKFLQEGTKETKLVPLDPIPHLLSGLTIPTTNPNALGGLFGLGPQISHRQPNNQQRIADLLYGASVKPTIPPAPKYREEITVTGWDVNWQKLLAFLEG